jgi:ligand-binding SRPBCC domain-containing protein
MTLHSYRAELWLPQPRPVVFAFFAEARNLEAITPPWLNFEVLTPAPIALRPGARIDYRLRLHGIPFRWQTEITAWEPPCRFIDSQRKGPYRRWVHTHTFTERDGGTWCTDDVSYAVPGGALIERLFVRRDVERIFAFRAAALRRRFGARDGAPNPDSLAT